MCLASKYINNLEEALKGIQDGVKELSEKLSYYDKEKNRIYHKIEVSNYNAAEGFYAYKELQRVLQERRIIKDELAKLKVVNQHLNTKATKGQTENAKHHLNKFLSKGDGWSKDYDISIFDLIEDNKQEVH